MTVRSKVERQIMTHPGSTARQISEAIFGLGKGYQARVNPICLDLCERGLAHRDGAGTRDNPYHYHWGKRDA